MANAEQQVVRLMAQEIARAIKKATEDNNKNYVENQLKNFKGSGVPGASGNGGYVGGSVDASQVVGLYSAVAGYIANSPDYAQSGDIDAGRIITTIAGLAAIEIQSATIDTAQIKNLYSSYGEFLNLVAKNAEIEGLDVEELRAAISEIGLANIGSASIDWAQIKDLVTDTAIIREGLGGKLYIDRLAVTDAQILSLTTGELVIQAQDGKLYTVYVDENGEVKTELRTIDGTDIKDGTIQGSNIADNTITGALITENAITARELNVSKIFADEALIRAIKAANLDVDDLFANEGFINTLTTNIIKSPSIGKDLDISENSSIVLAEKKIGMVVSSESSESELVLTDDMLNIITDKAQIAANNIDLSANESITAIVKKEVSEIADTIFVGEEPALPVVDMVWLDTSVSPNLFKRWNGEQWVVVNDVADLLERINSAQLKIDANTASIKSVAESTDELGGRIQSAEEKITPDAIIQTVRKREEYKDDIASATMTSEKFETFVADSKGIADMQMTSEKFETFVENSEGIADLEMTAEKFETLVENSEGISKLEMTPEKFETFIESSDGVAKVSQKANEIDMLIQGDSTSTNVKYTDAAIEAMSENIDLKVNNEFNLTIDEIRTSIKANTDGIEMAAQEITLISRNARKNTAKVFRQEEFPDGRDDVEPNDVLVIPSSGQIYQAIDMSNLNIKFYLESNGDLTYSIDDSFDHYKLEMQGYDLYAENFTITIKEDGTVGSPYNWELVQDLELLYGIEGLEEEFRRVIRIDNDGLHIGDNKSNNEVLIDSESVNIKIGATNDYSKFTAKYVQFGSYQLRQSADGGLVFKMR